MQSVSVLAILAIALSCAWSLDDTLSQHWNLWKQTNNKRYSDVEEHVRRAIWESNLKKVEEHNLQADLGVHTYWLGMNKYADLTISEFVKQINGFNVTVQGKYSQRSEMFAFNPSSGDLPDNVDWRDKGCVVSVKDQGQSGSRWAFSVIGSIESEFCIASGKLISLSEQQLIDCATKEGNMSRNGSLIDQAFQAVIDMGGLEREDVYPYHAADEKCHLDPTKIAVKITGFVDITSRDEHALKQAVATVGPISVAIDASHTSFQLYKSGIYNEPFCSQTSLDHSVVVIGYGTDSGKDYWLVKNSWGTSWGNRGYIQMTRNKRNQCGIATMASYPTV